jgi:hypothetical protein
MESGIGHALNGQRPPARPFLGRRSTASPSADIGCRAIHQIEVRKCIVGRSDVGPAIQSVAMTSRATAPEIRNEDMVPAFGLG